MVPPVAVVRILVDSILFKHRVVLSVTKASLARQF